MNKATIELDPMALTCIQYALNLCVLNAQATLSMVQAQVQAQLDAEAAAPPVELSRE